MQVYHLFGWFWLMNFIIALGQCVLAGAFASYYWAWDKKTVSTEENVNRAFRRTTTLVINFSFAKVMIYYYQNSFAFC